MTEPEPDWVERLQENHPGRNASIAALRKALAQTLQKSLKGRPAADAAFIEDVCQEALLRILDKLDSFQGRSRFLSWAIAIALRVAMNELRRREWKTLSIEAISENGSPLDLQIERSPAPDESSERRSVNEILHETIKTELTEKQQAALLAELNGIPQEEIARQLGSTRNTVYKLFHDARKALKLALEKRGFGPNELIDAYSSRNRKTIR